jgi:hypothetical protein
MTDGLDQAIANIVLGLLGLDNGIPNVFDGFVPAGQGGNAIPPPYVLVYTTVERPVGEPSNSADGRSRTFVARWYCHCVGANAIAARAMAQRVRTQLLDVRPTGAPLASLNCGLIRHESSTPPRRDETTGSLVMDAIETYVFRATS